MAGPRRIFGLRVSAVAEIALFLGVVLLLDWVAFSGDRFFTVEPHPFWIIVLLVSAQYGTPEGVAAAAAAAIALLAGNVVEQGLEQDVYDYVFHIAKNPVLWFVGAIALGEVRSRHQREKAEFVSELHELRARAHRLSEAYKRVSRIKENLEVRVAGQLRTFLSTYETAKLIERSDPGEVLLAIVDVIRAIIAPEKFSLFLLNDDVLEAAIQDGWVAGDPYGRVIDKSHRLYQEIVEERRIVCITNEADEAVLGAEGVLAGPLIRTDSDAVIGMLKVERLDLLDLNVSTVENLRALSTWIGTAYAKAVDAASRADEGELTAGRDVMPQRYLMPQQYFLVSLGRRLGFDICALTLTLANPGEVPVEHRARVNEAVSAAVRLGLGASAMPFEQGADGVSYVVLLPGLALRSAEATAERFKSSLDVQLRSRAPEARFTAAVRALYAHEKRA